MLSTVTDIFTSFAGTFDTSEPLITHLIPSPISRTSFFCVPLMAAIASFETTPVSSILTTIVSFAEAFLIVSTSLLQSTFVAGVGSVLPGFAGVGSVLPGSAGVGSTVFFTLVRITVPPSFAAGIVTATVLSLPTVYVAPLYKSFTSVPAAKLTGTFTSFAVSLIFIPTYNVVPP